MIFHNNIHKILEVIRMKGLVENQCQSQKHLLLKEKQVLIWVVKIFVQNGFLIMVSSIFASIKYCPRQHQILN